MDKKSIFFAIRKILIYVLSSFIISLIWVNVIGSNIAGPTSAAITSGFATIFLGFSTIPSSITVYFLQRRVVKINSRDRIISKSLFFNHLLLYIFVFYAWITLPLLIFDVKLFLISIELCIIPIFFISLIWIFLFIFETK